MSDTKKLVDEIDALYAKATTVEWRPLHTRVDGADGYQIIHGDLHGKTDGENLANLRLAAALVNAWPQLKALSEQVERLTRERDVARDAAQDKGVSLDVLALAAKVVIAEHRAKTTEADAERYRYLRNDANKINGQNGPLVWMCDHNGMPLEERPEHMLHGRLLDAAIDRSLTQSSKG